MKQTEFGNRFPLKNEITYRAKRLPKLPWRWKTVINAALMQARKAPHDTFSPEGDETVITFRRFAESFAALSFPIKRKLGSDGTVGILLPPTPTKALAAVTNFAVIASGNIAVNLPLNVGEGEVNYIIHDAGVKHVITSREVMKVEHFAKMHIDAEIVFVEDLAAAITDGDKIEAGIIARVRGGSELLPGARHRPDDVVVINYTTGSTDNPKGVEITNKNMLTNVWQIFHTVNLKKGHKILAVLPLSHTLGLNLTVFAVAILGLTAVYHPKATDIRNIVKLIKKHGVTMIASTPALFRAYLPFLNKDNCATVEMILLGAQKVEAELARDVEEKLGIRVIEGYGLTEFCPVVAANVMHDVVTPDGRTVDGNKLGTVGQPVWGIDVAIMNLKTDKLCGLGEEGAIFLRGDNRMKGYHNKPEATNEAISEDGWYFTGDVGFVDEDGFLHITDRLKNFIKPYGDMVAAARIAAAARQIAGITEDAIAAVGLPDADKGERTAILYTGFPEGITPAIVSKGIGASGIPKAAVPDEKDFYLVDALPVGATGKIDLRALKQLARDKAKAAGRL